MASARAEVEVPGPVSAAEELWYDLGRWASFVDGFHHVVKVEGDWPRTGARVVWDSVPQGRGRVVEHVASFQPRVGQTVEVEDERLVGMQSVAFEALDDGRARVILELDWRLKGRNPVSGLVDVLFVRRAFAESLRSTLSRFARERRADVELGDRTP